MLACIHCYSSPENNELRECQLTRLRLWWPWLHFLNIALTVTPK